MKGFAALITILIILSISLILGLTISQLSINELIMGLNKNFSSQAYYLANLCAEQALINLKEDSNYQGNEIINIDKGSCNILEIEENRIIKVIGEQENQIRKIQIIVEQINPKMIIQSWREVADF